MREPLDLGARRHWIFDLDGTLTRAVHDFASIRHELGLPQGKPILEALDALPRAESLPLYLRLDEIELGLARRAQAAVGAVELLRLLRSRDARLGIVTRNSLRNALETLRASGLDPFFDAERVLGRDEAAPKPDPDGPRLLMERWSADPAHGVMIGDYHYDLTAGRAAGLGTIYVDPSGRFPWAAEADLLVRGLDELHAMVEAAAI